MAMLSSVPSAFFLASRRCNSRTDLPAIAMPKSANSNSSHLPPTFSTFRFRKAVSLHGRRRAVVPLASETNPSDQDTLEEKAKGGANGPPFLTILAGLVVFVFICWIVGSIVMWLIGLIVNVPPS